MAYLNKDKQREAQRNWARKNRELNADKVKQASRKRRRLAFDFVRSIKEKAICADCKIDYPYYILQFDHVTDDKVSNVSKMVAGAYAIDTIKSEIDKCEIVCANCHSHRTWSREHAK